MQKIEEGSIRNGLPWLPKDKRKKILLLSDDLRLPSGVGTMSREFVLGTCHHFNYCQVGAAINHPDIGKKLDLSQATEQELGIKDPSIVVYPNNGYGDENLIRFLLETEKPDAILHYTDPRFFGWLYQMEHEIRAQIPIFYYCIWDDLPYPRWNAPFYASCDLMMSISKQSYGIHYNVLKHANGEVNGNAVIDESKYKYTPSPVTVTYVPHGINEDVFYPIRVTNKEHVTKQVTVGSDGKQIETDVVRKDSELLAEFRKQFFGDEDVDFVVLYVNRNIRRKLPGDVVLAYKTFCDMLTPEQAKKCALLMHTQPIDENGTDLPVVVKELCPYRVAFSSGRIEPTMMNIVHNLADVTINLASNEGFGLGTCESMMSGNMIIVNVTGGLQDQCGFKLNGKYLTAEDYLDIGSLHDRDIWKNNELLTHGEWVKPVWPSNRSLQGSPPTPYIFDDRPDYKEAAQKLREVYDLGKEERDRRGLLAREYVTTPEIGMAASEMSRRFMQDMNLAFENWKPRKKFSVFMA